MTRSSETKIPGAMMVFDISEFGGLTGIN
jgi:hypothetical protein